MQQAGNAEPAVLRPVLQVAAAALRDVAGGFHAQTEAFVLGGEQPALLRAQFAAESVIQCEAQFAPVRLDAEHDLPLLLRQRQRSRAGVFQ